MIGDALLELQEVSKLFPAGRVGAGPVTVLDGVSFSVCPGEIVGLIGASGAGKSTVARLVTGLARPDRGRILFEGRDLSRLSGTERRAMLGRMHLVFQDPYDALPPMMSVREIVAEPLVIHGTGTRADREELIRAALTEAALGPFERYCERFPRELSGGERQRIALARALVLRPRLIVADEPTTMLDASLRLDLLNTMRRLRDQQGIAYLYITHDLALAQVFCDRLVILDQGRVAEEGPTDQVISSPRHFYTTALVQAALALQPKMVTERGKTVG